MELKRNLQPLSRKVVDLAPPGLPPSEPTPTLQTSQEASQQAPEGELVLPVLQRVPKPTETVLEASGSIPQLQVTPRRRQVVELAAPGTATSQPTLSPQPVAATEATVEPVQAEIVEITGGGRSKEWPFGEESEEETDGEAVGEAPEDELIPTQPDTLPSLSEAVLVAPGAIQESLEVPSLQILRDGGALPTGLVEIPPLAAFNNMEVVYLLIGKSDESEEITLLQSFAEKEFRGKDREEITRLVQGKVVAHFEQMNYAGINTAAERRPFSNIRMPLVSSLHKSRGLEKHWVLEDNGGVLDRDLHEYAGENGIDLQQAFVVLKRDVKTVYSWSLIKVKIGQDFGSFKFSELFPTA